MIQVSSDVLLVVGGQGERPSPEGSLLAFHVLRALDKGATLILSNKGMN